MNEGFPNTSKRQLPRTHLSFTNSHQPPSTACTTTPPLHNIQLAHSSDYYSLHKLYSSIDPKLAMPSTTTSCVLLIISLAFLSATPPTIADSPTVYEVLESYDFPVGLLPKGVTSYELDRSTGKFTVYLNKTCSFTIDGYNLRYKSKITGTISKDRIKNLNGIQVKVLLFWVNIVEVTRDGDELDLSVGIVSASFEVDNFDESPQCGCGFDCVNFAGGRRSDGRFSFRKFAPLLQL